MQTAPAADRREHFQDLQRRSAKARSVAAVERRIRDLVDAAPPMTEAQKGRIRSLLQGSGGEAA